MTAVPENAKVPVTRLGTLEGLAYAGTALAVAGSLRLIYASSGGGLILLWWARALLDGAFLVAGLLAVTLLRRRPATPARLRGSALATSVVAIAAGVVAAEVLGGSGVLANTIQYMTTDHQSVGTLVDVSPALAVGAAITLVMLAASLLFRANLWLVTCFIAATLATVVLGLRGVGATSVSGQADPLVAATAVAGAGLILLVVSLFPRVRRGIHGDVLGFAAVLVLVGGFTLGLGLDRAPMVVSSAPGGGQPWLTLVGVGLSLVFLAVATRGRTWSRGIASASVAGLAFSLWVLTERAMAIGLNGGDSTLAVGLVTLIGGAVVLLSALIFLTLGARPAAVAPSTTGHPPATGTAAETATPPAPAAAPRGDDKAETAGADAAADGAPADPKTAATPADAPSDEGLTAGEAAGAAALTPAKRSRRKKGGAESADAAAAPPEPPATPPAEPASAAGPGPQLALDAPSAPPTEGADVPSGTPHAGARISDDRHFWWDDGAAAWKRVPVSDDGYYYFDGADWKPRQG